MTPEDFRSGAIFQEFDHNGVAVVIIQKKDVAVSSARCNGVLAGDVGENLASISNVVQHSEDFVGLVRTVVVWDTFDFG